MAAICGQHGGRENALLSLTSGGFNTADGAFALSGNTTGSPDTAIGARALSGNIARSSNTAIGDTALTNSTGSNNTAIGETAGLNLTTGDHNIGIGYNVVGVAGESNTIRIGDTHITDTYIRGIIGATSSGGPAVFVNGNGKLGTTR